MRYSCLFHATWDFGTVPERSTRHTESICVHHTKLLRNTKEASRKGSLGWVSSVTQRHLQAEHTGQTHWPLRLPASPRGGTQLAGPGMQD